MADEKKSFDTLLSEAPMFAQADTVTLTGALARSPEEGKFVLVQADGSGVTIAVAAVQEYTVLGASFGQQIIQVELDPKQVPEEVAAQAVSLATHTRPNPILGAERPIVRVPQAVPFALATPHHVSDDILTEMNALSSASPLARGGTDPDSDFVKSPRSDGTYPVYVNGHKLWHLDS